MVKILICDDDPTFAQSMFKRILSLPAYSSKSMKLSCLTDIAEMSANTIAQYDILFLDIDLGKESGIDLARKMRKMNPEAVLIFVTNFSEYAPEGYEVDTFRYLAKSELEKKLPTYFEDALAMCRTRQRKVEILCEGESVPIPVQSLAWIESQGREQYLHLVGGCREQLITRLTMAQLEDLLVPHGFLRIHKSYLVNMAYCLSLRHADSCGGGWHSHQSGVSCQLRKLSGHQSWRWVLYALCPLQPAFGAGWRYGEQVRHHCQGWCYRRCNRKSSAYLRHYRRCLRQPKRVSALKQRGAASANTQERPSYFYLSEQYRQVISSAVQHTENFYSVVFPVHTVENQLL